MNNQIKTVLAGLMLGAAFATPAAGAGFVNGGFEDGNANGWEQGGGTRVNVFNNALNPNNFVPGDGGARSSIINAGATDPNVAGLGSIVYSGNHSYRVENTVNGGLASVLRQQVNNYTDANIFFAWKAVLEGAHGVTDAATMVITLRDLTDGVDLITRQYNAASGGGGVDARFTLDGASGAFYTANWQIEQLAIDASLAGHDFLLSVLAADCELTGHYGYVYLDGFGAVAPPPGNGIPEPASWLMMILGFGLVGSAMRRRRQIETAIA